MKEINDAIKLVILKRKLEAYQNTYYDTSLELEIAEELGNQRLAEGALKKMADQKKAIALLEGKIEELESKVEEKLVELE